MDSLLPQIQSLIQDGLVPHADHILSVAAGAIGCAAIGIPALLKKATDLYQSRLIQRILAATDDDSPGGSSITRDELLAIITDPQIRAGFVALFTEKA